MINSEINFNTGFKESGPTYGDIQASGNVRNILSALIAYFTTVNSTAHTDSHHGTTIRLVDYPFNVKFGQFGQIARRDHKKLGLVFDGGGNWYGHVNAHGRSESRERHMTVETKTGLMKILTDLVGEDKVFDKWNHENESTGFSIVLDLPMEWVQHDHNHANYEEEITKMVASLNKVAKSFKALQQH